MTKIYVDENFSHHLADGLAILEKPNNDGVEVYSIKNEFGQGAKDEDWIPKIGLVHGIVITQDLNIQRTHHLKALYERSGVGVFFFKAPSKNGFTYWEMVLQVINRWLDIKKLARKNKPPFAFRCTSRKEFEPL